MPEPPEYLRDAFPAEDSFSRSTLPAVQHRYDYLLARRDQLNDRIRGGALALNAASLVGVVSALGTDAIADGQFGLTPGHLAFSASCFIIGMIAAVVSFAVESWRLPMEAARQFARLIQARTHRAILDQKNTPNAVAKLDTSMAEAGKLPQADFDYSPAATRALNVSGGAWIGGVLAPLFDLVPLIDWLG